MPAKLIQQEKSAEAPCPDKPVSLTASAELPSSDASYEESVHQRAEAMTGVLASILNRTERQNLSAEN